MCALPTIYDKTRIVHFNSKSARGDIPFLGFTFYWGRRYTQAKMLKVKTTPKRLGKSIKDFTEWIKGIRHRKCLDEIWKLAAAKIQGHYNYYGVRGNSRAIQGYSYQAQREWFAQSPSLH